MQKQAANKRTVQAGGASAPSVFVAAGHTAEIFAVSDKRVLKLFKRGYSSAAVGHEYANHLLVSAMTDNVPQIYHQVEKYGRFGFIMENVQGISLASLMMEEETFDQAMNIFANIHKEWLMKESDDGITYTEWMLNTLKGKDVSQDLTDRIRCLPQGNVLCHGDFHPYNIIITPEGRPVVIDFANVCRAPREYDIGRTYFLLREAVREKPLADIYLERMERKYSDIQEYIEVLECFRPCEQGGDTRLA